MCGLTGYIDLKNSIASLNVVKQMLQFQTHRGPDDSGIVLINSNTKTIDEYRIESSQINGIPTLAFGFNRLSILDLSENGHQPMLSPDSTVVLMMNGEIYNAFDYTDDLKSKGYVFKGSSDTEVVLALYLQYGLEEMLQMLNGMFALSIYDSRLNKLFLVRDRFGIKPLYILKNENYFAFSSEMKSFKALENFSFQLDEDGLSEYFLYRNRINSTLFKDIVNLEPGVFLTYDLSENTCKHDVFYDINNIDSTKNKDYTVAKLENDLQQAVKSQLLSDITLGSQLSGGVDSSIVTHIAAANSRDEKFKSISIVFDDKSFSEEKYVDEVGLKTEVEINKYVLDSKFYLENLQKATWHFEQPLNHPNTIGIFFLSKNAKKHVSVLLSGEGADEVYGGYGSYIRTVLQPFSIKYMINNLRNNTSKFLTLMSFHKSLVGRRIFTNTLGNVLEPSLMYKKFSIADATKQRLYYSSKVTGDDFDKQRKYDLLTFLPDLLMRQDKMSMAFSIENRVPFLDNNLVAKAFTIDKDMLVEKVDNKFIGKSILKKLSAKYFGDAFTYRSKQGFAIPLREFFTSEDFDKMFYDDLLPSMKKRNIVNTTLIENYKKNISTLSQQKVESLWVAISFEVWAKLYLD